MNRQDILRKTVGKNKASILFREFEDHAPTILLRSLDEFAANQNLDLLNQIGVCTTRIYVDLASYIGATHGESTSFVCYQVDPSTGLAHCFPISPGEVKDQLDLSDPLPYCSDKYPLCYFDDLQGLLGNIE